jgi:hypothetical protein
MMSTNTLHTSDSIAAQAAHVVRSMANGGRWWCGIVTNVAPDNIAAYALFHWDADLSSQNNAAQNDVNWSLTA